MILMIKKRNLRIALISPASPFRGGIATHSNQLYYELIKNFSVKIFNYKRQYPALLFPGKSQYEDNPNIIHDREIDSINFFSWEKSARKIKEFKPDLVLFRFWHPFFSISLRSIAKKIKIQNKNCKIVALIDNIIPHERFLLDSFFSSLFLKSMDGFLVQSSQVESDLIKLVNKPKYIKILHPFYDHYPINISSIDARSNLGIGLDTKVFLFFGFIRPYKGLDVLLNSLQSLEKQMSNYIVLVVGESYERIEKYKVIVPKELKHKVIWENKYIGERDIGKFFSASDVLVLPYRSCTQSGVVQVGYHYGLPVVASDIKGFQDYVVEGQTGYLFKSGSSEDLAAKLIDAISLNLLKVSKGINKFKERCTWDFFSKNLIGFYESL